MFKGRDFLSVADLDRSEVQSLLALGLKLKSDITRGRLEKLLAGKSIGLLFEKPSTRTRVSFQVAITELGGTGIYLRPDELQLGRGEPLKDTSRVLGAYLDGVIIRTYKHEFLTEFADHSPIQVINALSDLEHPTQIVSDMLTIVEAKGELSGLKFAWIGDGNNVCNSWLLGGAIMGMRLSVACPKSYRPDKGIMENSKLIRKQSKASIELTESPRKAVEDADVIYTDVWVSMGQEKTSKAKIKAFKGFQVNSSLVAHAKKDVAVMHCLPAHRGQEITDDVLEGPNSLVWRQSENKLHGARAVLAAYLGA